MPALRNVWMLFLGLAALHSVLARPGKPNNVAGVAVFASTNGNVTEHHVQYLSPEEAEQLFIHNQQQIAHHQQHIFEAINAFQNPINIFQPDFFNQIFSHVTGAVNPPRG